jgi:hypothetical protein
LLVANTKFSIPNNNNDPPQTPERDRNEERQRQCNERLQMTSPSICHQRAYARQPQHQYMAQPNFYLPLQPPAHLNHSGDYHPPMVYYQPLQPLMMGYAPLPFYNHSVYEQEHVFCQRTHVEHLQQRASEDKFRMKRLEGNNNR